MHSFSFLFKIFQDYFGTSAISQVKNPSQHK